MNTIIQTVLNDLRNHSLKAVYDNKYQLNLIAMGFLNKPGLNLEEQKDLGDLLSICNITYNRTDKTVLPIEDGVYDLLLERYKEYNPNFQVGSEVIDFQASANDFAEREAFIDAVRFMGEDENDKIFNAFYKEDLIFPDMRIDSRDTIPIAPPEPINVTKRKHDTVHSHPELVGTLDKCKFVYIKDAVERGVDNDPKVKILERDFFMDQMAKGVINPNKQYTILMELKYDGVSVEADCTDVVISARSRGDTGIGQASDMTPILAGYKFPHRDPSESMCGVKFEAIMTRHDLQKFNDMKGYKYKNCRSAIVGLLASADSWKYRDLITLVPLQVDAETFYGPDIQGNAIAEVEYLNDKFVSHGTPMRYSVASGNVSELLYQIHLFQQEAEMARSIIPFMYDGIVIHYVDNDLREILGRENFINKYSMAIKFNPLKKQTVFRGYTFTVGQDGSITPMIHYDPVEFYGTIHPKSSGHSLKRFMELGLRVGDVIDVEYINDVMPYVDKPDNAYNDENAMKVQLFPFPNKCPICGGDIVISKTGRSAYCSNMDCEGRKSARLANMCAKLNMDGFGDATITKLRVTSLKHMMEMLNENNAMYIQSLDFGPVETVNMINEAKRIMTTPMEETVLFGSIGFTDVAEKTWRLVFENMSYEMFFDMYNHDALYNALIHIKGIGPTTANTIVEEYPFFKDDIEFMYKNANIVRYTKATGKIVRATGFRDKELFAYLRTLGFDADDNGSLTKDTDILLVPEAGHTSSKTQKAQQYGVQIIPIGDFRENIEKYL